MMVPIKLQEKILVTSSSGPVACNSVCLALNVRRLGTHFITALRQVLSRLATQLFHTVYINLQVM